MKYFKGSTDGRKPLTSDPLARAESSYDLIVIGSGLAGLTAANVLGRLGHKVALFEQHYNLGGMATWFKRRGGHVFDVSLHGFPYGMVKTCRRYWGAEIAERIVRLDGIRFDNPQFALDTTFTREDFTALLVERFGAEPRRVAEFFDFLRGLDYYDDRRDTVADVFEQYFPGRNDIHRLLLEPIAYANGSTLSDPAIAYGIVFSNFMSKGVFTFRGGTDALIREMKAELARNGVSVFNNVDVDRIVVQDGAVRGIEAHGRRIAARAVVSNANLKKTVLELCGPEHFDPSFVEGLRAVRLNNSSCQVYFGVREGAEIPWLTDLLFSSTRPRFDSEALCDFRGESRTFSFYYPKVRPGSNRFTIVSSTNASYADWAALDAASYATEKQRLIEETFVALERYLPEIRSLVDHVEASTPRTFEFYTRHAQGASFGTKWEGLRYSLDLCRQVEGLYHAGSVGIIMSGWLGAANYGVITANKVDLHLRTPVEAPR
jgi:all-trans-retinol 13,14-reductase